MLSELLNYTTYRFANEPVREYPFPHFLLHDAFHTELYRALLAQWPEDGAFVSSRRYNNLEPLRHFVRLTAEGLDRLPGPQAAFSRDIVRWFERSELLDLVFGKHKSLQRLRGRLDRTEGRPLAELVRHNVSLAYDHTGYQLQPHADDPRVVFNMLFYITEDATHPGAGTTLYVLKDRSFVSRGEPRHPRADFESVVTLPYLPNTMFGFIRSERSFHGVEPVTEVALKRRLLVYSFMLKDDVAPPAGHSRPRQQPRKD
jgi:hypothetical protein